MEQFEDLTRVEVIIDCLTFYFWHYYFTQGIGDFRRFLIVVGQSNLLKSSMLVVGAGGLGSPALLYLAACGVGKKLLYLKM